MTRFKTIKSTRKTHQCYECLKMIPVGSTCTYGITTEHEIIRCKNQIIAAYFCIECRNIGLNRV